MADGAYERRSGREAELKRFERLLREAALSRAGADPETGGPRTAEAKGDVSAP